MTHYPRIRGRPATQRARIVALAAEMQEAGLLVNKSRIARELRIPLRTVFRALQRPDFCHMHKAL